MSAVLPSAQQFRRSLALFLAALLGVFVVWQAPHTVHHFFEPESEDPEHCALAASVDRGLATETAEVVVAELPRPAGAAPSSARAVARVIARPERDARGPPSLPS
jgi:hypothetical protein